MPNPELSIPRIDLTRRFCQLGHARSKVVATIGPTSEDRIAQLIDAGMSVARLNFSHGTYADHRRRADKIRRVSEQLHIPVGILADIRGPKLRLGKIGAKGIRLEVGETVRLCEGRGPFDWAGKREVPIDVAGVREKMEPGQRVYLGDGVVELVVEEFEGDAHRARVRRGGRISDGKGVHIPDTVLDLAVPTDRDREDLAFAHELDVDFVGVSYVAKASEIHEVRSLVPNTMVVSKIERAVALANIDEILAASDGIMVARGDLGVEVELEEVPMVQKSLLQLALRAGKFTITATEMLESMVTASRPTRAEVTDVANAVLDGTDAVMLSAETAVGDHPVEAVAAMDKIASAVEASQYYQDLPRIGFRSSESTFSNAAALAAAKAADALGIGKIIAFTKTGNTVRLLSRYRPQAEVIAMSPDPRTLRQMTILAHVRPMYCAQAPTLEDMLEQASEDLTARGLVHVGDQVVFVAGVPPGVASTTNVLKLHRIGDPIKLA